MVASTHWLASAAGMAVLERGGNAFDAGVAAGFTLQVVEPHLNGPGGDLPAILWPAGGDPVVLCAQGPAPRAATIAHYRDELGLSLVPGTGPLAAVVPGAFGGWLALLRDHGTLSLRDVLRFAVGYAEDGYPAIAHIAAAIRSVEPLFRDEWTTSSDVYLPILKPGTLHRNVRLAATYRRIVDEAETRSSDRDGQIAAALDSWYRGFVADAFLRFQEREWLDSSGERHAGLLDEDDLRDWAPAYEAPLDVDYEGVRVLKAGPWSQAPVFLQQLRLLEGFDLGAMGQASADWVHTITECAKLAFADREAWYGDPDFTEVPLGALLSRDYAEERRQLLGEEASPEPGKRPRTTLSRTIAARDSESSLALGTPGGDQQDQWTLHVFLGHVHHGLDLQAAIDAPNHHTEAFPSSFYPRESRPRHVAVEERAGAETVAGLRARGHDVEVSPPWSLGRVSAVAREADGQLKAGANPRGMQGYAVGR